MPRITLLMALQITSHILIDYLLANSRERSWSTDDGEGQVSGALAWHLRISLLFCLTISLQPDCGFPHSSESFVVDLRLSIQRNLTLCSERLSLSVSWKELHCSAWTFCLLLQSLTVGSSYGEAILTKHRYYGDFIELAYKVWFDPIPEPQWH